MEPRGAGRARSRRCCKALLAQGAQLPKHLMLYVKNMLFFDGAIAHLAPDLNMFEEVAKIYAYFAMQPRRAHRARRRHRPEPRTRSTSTTCAPSSASRTTSSRSRTASCSERRSEIQKRIDAGGGLPVVDDKEDAR